MWLLLAPLPNLGGANEQAYRADEARRMARADLPTAIMRSATPGRRKRLSLQPGTSGNPKGRPKSAKNEATILRNIFNRQIEVRDGGRVREVSVLEGMLLRFTDDAVKGNPKSAAFLLNRYRLAEGDAPEPTRSIKTIVTS